MTYASWLLATFLAWLVAVVVIDIRTHRAPNRLVYPSMVLGVAAVVPLGVTPFLQAVSGGALAFTVLAIIVLLGGGRMGAGDAKVGAVAGLVVGAAGVPTMIASAFLSGSVFALIMLGLRLRDRRDSVAFTPMLLGGVLMALVTRASYLVD